MKLFFTDDHEFIAGGSIFPGGRPSPPPLAPTLLKQTVFTAVSYRIAQNCPSGWGYVPPYVAVCSWGSFMSYDAPPQPQMPPTSTLLATHIHKICRLKNGKMSPPLDYPDCVVARVTVYLRRAWQRV